MPVGLHQADNFLYEAVVQQGRAFGFPVEPQPPVDFFYEPEGTLTFGDYVVTIRHTPGHCPGGVCLTVENADRSERSLFVGDTLFAGSIGRTDLPGGDTEVLLRSINEVLFAYPDDTPVYSGHGAPTTIGRGEADESVSDESAGGSAGLKTRPYDPATRVGSRYRAFRPPIVESTSPLPSSISSPPAPPPRRAACRLP